MPVAAGAVMSAKYPVICCTYDCRKGRDCPLRATPPIPKATGDEMNTKTDTAASSPLVEDVRAAMRQAFSLGQTYWQQADSDSVSQNRKSDETATKFRQLVTDTCTALAAGIAQPAAPSDAAPVSTLTQSRDPWTDEQRANHRANKALVYRCTICCAKSGEPHLPSCSEGRGICGEESK